MQQKFNTCEASSRFSDQSALLSEIFFATEESILASQIQNILDHIIERSGLDPVDKHPLYAYKVTQEELLMLQAALKDALQVNPELRKKEQQAAFCLFGAEWFRRNHDQGPWSWDIILDDGLGLKGSTKKSFRNNSVRHTTAAGLNWWKVPLVETEIATQYLVTLACQGGLPLKTLRNHVAPLRRFLKKMLQHHERYPQEPINGVFEEYAFLLPKTLNNSGVQTLTCRIVDCVANLRRSSKAVEENGQGRQEYLDQNLSGWRDSIPLRIDDSDAMDLILGLLDQEVARALPSEGFSVTTFLTMQDQSILISRDLNYESVINEEDLWRWLELSSAKELQPRMTLYLQSDTQQVRVGTIAKRSIDDSYVITSISSTPLTGSDADGTIRLVVTAGNRQVSSIVVPGGEALPESPWVFSDADPAELIGVGSVKTRYSTVLVAIPPGVTWVGSPEMEVLIDSNSDDNRIVMRLSGELCLCQDGNDVRICSRAEEEATSIFKLRGRGGTLGPNGSSFWYGIPEIIEYPVNSSGTVSDVPQHMIEWKGTGNTWQNLSSNCVGDVSLRAVRNHETIFQTRLTLLPDGFSYRIRPRRNNKGTIELKNLGMAAVFPGEISGVETQVESQKSVTQLHVTLCSGSDRPVTIPISIHFHNGVRSYLQATCPTDGIYIVNAAGLAISKNLPIPMDQLDGLFLRILTPKSQDLILIERSRHRFLGKPTEFRNTGTQEFALSSVQEIIQGILAQSDDPDGSVEIRLERPPSSIDLFSFKVARYPGWLEKEPNDYSETGTQPDCTEVFVSEQTLQDLRISGEDIRIDVSPLGQPDAVIETAAVQRIGEAKWKLSHEMLGTGIYLVVAWINEFRCLRPLRVSVNLNLIDPIRVEDAEPSDQFDTALNTLSHDVRRFEWEAFVNRIACDSGHPGWARIDSLIKSNQRLPLTTYEAISSLIRNSDATAMLAIRMHRLSWLWQRLEELPFLWATVPVRSWVTALRCHVELLLQQLDSLEADMSSQIIESKIEGFSQDLALRWGGGVCINSCLHISGFKIPPQNINIKDLMVNEQDSLLERLQQERSRLIADHDLYDTRTVWPQVDLRIPERVRGVISDIEISDGHSNQWEVLNAPAIAAAYSVHDFPLPPLIIMKLKELRSVDPVWFDRANVIAMQILAGRRLTQNHRCFVMEEKVEV
ncbi:STY4851/ECs_5259 family protein [Gimesia maris]|nr:STY4851/ECs_5259 family protein [Gimesia maris]EDL62311.1 hypothetical protein PM8797T_28324 [Gimesia maris DSM 8797]QGQ29611.1 hypothetical protein F1729_13650 [Gimesia maris]